MQNPYICVHVYMCMRMYVYVYMYIYIYIHTHVYRHIFAHKLHQAYIQALPTLQPNLPDVVYQEVYALGCRGA